jgi:hypothetical protein
MNSIVPIPRSKDELLSRLDSPRTRNQLVLDIVVALTESSDKFVAYISATSNVDAVEGSTRTDDKFAANEIREYAKEHRISIIADLKVDAIVPSMKVALERLHLTRKERAGMFDDGTVVNVPEEDNKEPEEE